MDRCQLVQKPYFEYLLAVTCQDEGKGQGILLSPLFLFLSSLVDCHQMFCSFAQHLSHLLFAYHARMSDLGEKGNHIQSTRLSGNLYSLPTGAPCAHKPNILHRLHHTQNNGRMVNR